MQCVFLLIILLLADLSSTKKFKTEKEIERYLRNIYEKNANTRCSRFKSALWNFETDLNDTKKAELFKNVSLIQAQGIRDEWNQNFKSLTAKQSWSDDIKRKISLVKKIGNHALELKDFKNLTNIINNMTLTYKSVKICPFNKKKCKKSEMLSLEPDLKNRMYKSTNLQELLYIWTNWRDVIGTDVKKQFLKYLELSNKAATLNGFKDAGQMWRSDYESSNFFDQIDDLWDDIRPLYNELHKYVLKTMKRTYSGQLDFDDGLIPAHILGDMWAHDWSHLWSVLKPYRKSYSINITQELVDQNYHVIDMYRSANSFYTSLGLLSNEMAYDANAMIEKPSDRLVDCENQNFDFCDGKHYRMKACSNVIQADFLEVHSQMAEIQYFQQYKNQAYSYRSPTIPAFTKAVGGAVELSASTPKYLSRIGLLDEYTNTYGSAINRLMERALKDIVSLPYNLLVDKWRWEAFSEGVNEKSNRQWWKYREYYQKIKPPVTRDNDNFDPGAQFYLVDGLHSIDQFIATILQFQIYKALCIKADQYNPKTKSPALNKCDFSQSRDAGKVLKSGLQLGKSKHWKTVLKEISNDSDLAASALLEYFAPLYEYLKDINKMKKDSSSTKKLPKKKKKKKHGRRDRERSFPIKFPDFDDDSFEADDEDFHDTETDFKTSLEASTDSINSETTVLNPTTLSVPYLTSFETTTEETVTEAVENISTTTEYNDSSRNQSALVPNTTTAFTDYTKVNNLTNLWPTVATESVNLSKTSEIADNETVTEENLFTEGDTYEDTEDNSTNLPLTTVELITFTVSTTTTSPINKDIETSSVNSFTQNYSIDFVYQRNSSTVSSVQVEMVTFAEVGRSNSTTKIVNNGTRSIMINLELICLFLLVLYKLF